MSDPSAATVADLDEELRRQAASLHAAVAAEQDHSAALLAERDLARAELASARADLAAVRALLADARAELQWLRRARIDLNAVMDHVAVRALRAAARAARAVARRVTAP